MRQRGKIANSYGTDFIKTELRVGLTFSNLALQSKDADKTSRNTAHAQSLRVTSYTSICHNAAAGI
jgi:hypothetical protein